jgi:uncharacterized delta-60 repeat protein
MKRKPLSTIISLVAKAAAPATAVATSLAAPLAQAASGDLDPSFADHGRLGPITELKGPARAVEAPEEGGVLLAGGIVESHCHWYYCWYDFDFEASNFVNAVTEEGGIDATYDGAQAGNIEVVDIARQADGKVVAAGRRINSRRWDLNHLVVFRLGTDGALDPAFGNQGIVELEADSTTVDQRASAILVEPDGHIAVAGVRNGELTIFRLDPAGAIDSTFGDGGFFTGPAYDYDAGSRLVRLASGGYRVTTSDAGACRVLGLTAGGSLDLTYGHGGSARVATGVADEACLSIAAMDDDRLVIAGTAGEQAFAVRLLANGAPDPSFSATEMAALAEATAIAVAGDGKILVGGDGVSGATVMRLQASGQLDPLFGEAGASTIDLPSHYGTRAVVNDLAVRADGSVIAAGGAYDSGRPSPFAVRLLGDAGGDSAGVLSIVQSYVDASESGDAVITVRRSGGRSGPVSVAYRTVAAEGDAIAGQDYDAASGRLHWDDGEAGEQSIVVPVTADGGAAEEFEYFNVALSNAQGGAGLGARRAAVTIQPDGAPAGQFSIESYGPEAYEGSVLEFWLNRNYYYEGTVCVTLTMDAESATASDDFDAGASTYCWGDQDWESKLVEIPILDDDEQETVETFSVELSDPTGGAVIGPRSSATFAIQANDAPQPPPPSGGHGGGGGAAGLLSLLLLGLAEAVRAARRWIRKPEPGAP